MASINFTELFNKNWMSVTEAIEKGRSNAGVSVFKDEENSSLYKIPAFQKHDDAGEEPTVGSELYSDDIDSASEETQTCAVVSKSMTLAELHRELTSVHQKERRRELRQKKVQKCNQALLQATQDKSEAQLALKKAYKDCKAGRKHFRAVLATVGVSSELLDEYQAFCDSLQPNSGISGFSILCDESHGGDYVDYDPEFEHFKDNVDVDYKRRNFRCEASTTVSEGRALGRSRTKRAKIMEHVVEFFLLPDIELLTGVGRTWGEQYPKLYELAIEAAKKGSGIALEMLVKLPGKNARVKGGWLFDYEFDEMQKDDLVVSNRWKFRSAHCIENPVSAEDKRGVLKFFVENDIY